MSFIKQLKKKQVKKGIKVDIDSILDDVAKARSENELQQCIDKYLTKYNGDKNAIKFALGVGCTQGMPLGIYVYCLKYMGFTEEEAIEQFKYFIKNTVKEGPYSKKRAEQIIEDSIDSFNKTNDDDVAYWVAQTFVPNPNNLPYVRHKDGNKENNSASNLEWCDKEEE